MNKLPYWNIPFNIPARFDTDSATAIEQTARVYGKMQELIEDYNAFVEKIEKAVTNIDEQTKKDIQSFEENITKLMNEFIECVNTTIDSQNRIIAEQDIKISELATIKFVYDAINESLNIPASAVEGV